MTRDGHPLLARVLRQIGARPGEAPSAETWQALLELVGRTYHEADQDRSTLEHELEAQRMAIAESYAVLRATLEASADGILVVDGQRQVIAVNQRFTALMRVPADIMATNDHPAMLAVSVQHFADPEAARRRVEEIHASSETVRDEITFIDGRVIDRYSAPVRLPDGTGVGRVTFFRDITAERTAHQQLERAREAAEAASDSKSMFLANMSHELRTPLNAVIGLADLLLLETGDPITKRQKEYLEAVTHSGRHLLALVNDVLDLAKIEAGKQDLELETVDVRDAIEEAMTGLVPLAHHRGVSIAIELALDLKAVRADRVRLRQILYNLMSNAVKFTDRDGQVTILALEEGEQIAIAVADTGIGIADEDLGRLYQAFEQLRQPSGDRPAGTGLGLALTRRLVDMHGGTITVASALGVGTTFTIRLPAA